MTNTGTVNRKYYGRLIPFCQFGFGENKDSMGVKSEKFNVSFCNSRHQCNWARLNPVKINWNDTFIAIINKMAASG